ncbi:P-loop containing nucleoside triphosphate hydrolase protein [Basidiobolus meristosporus CBS 931.73]|uniref:p-loop containing nucleoside triphosphate hydrolase protein n=1 Tax=Basidiobolus meristosporus CBS 931.73 TaxID=1314790 RepID=A0A1Y1Z6S5_9FUNG|nr:P-loop containing nucleoside triphosphate hydrolase protein [Basidiobolus meristosporus CBS 931.73]|eukprot:ORY05950.1 P-loop containing nucleoside triphosphate hydrolase protein [Basidiobolus meristosporus CBS 931.73]
MELAILKLLMSNRFNNAKIIYMAPIKALCSERAADWEQKFRPFGLSCKELTGDTTSTSIFDVKKCNIIVTTPEKWDSITRRWPDHQSFMKMIRLFMVDEVHILNEKRGAALEAVVSRMKAISNQIRYIAISATVPNVTDIAEWLGEGLPNEKPGKSFACVKCFGEEYRPVQLNRFVYGYPTNNASPFLFDRNLNFR